MKCDPLTADRIGANWLRAAIAPIGDFGRRAEDAAQPFGPGDELAARARCAAIVALAAELEADGLAHVRSALRRVPDPTDIVSRAVVGDPLGDVDFFELGRFADALDATARAWDGAGGNPSDRPPVIPSIVELLRPGREKGGFYLADAFGPALAAARIDYAAADADASRERRRLSQALASPLGMVAETDEFIVMRDGLAEVPPGVRVVRETPAYWLLGLQLDPAATAAEARCEAVLAVVAEHEDRVRRELANAIAQHGPTLLAAAESLGELDRTLARVAFIQRWGGCIPTFAATRLAFTRASFVPLRAALTDAGLSYTPITIDLAGAAVLTGPNMGGKSAALATCGFLLACVANGVPPPAEHATLPLIDTVAWIGGEPASEQQRLLSAFGAEVVRARDALAAAPKPSLLLVDEFARTTGPREGRALLVALVEALAQRGVFALVATHFEGVARAARVPHLTIAGLGPRSLDAHAARDIHAALDAVAHAMDYRIIPVDGDVHSSSDALALAMLLGLDAAIVERATVLFAEMKAGPVGQFAE